MYLDIKLVFSIIATLITIIWGFFPYIRDIFRNKTKPHIYTWLIWTITQGVATVGLIYGKGGWGALELLIGTFFVFIIFLLSFKYGTKNVAKLDTVMFVVALLFFVIWTQVQDPLLAVFMVSIVDILGYMPSFRKTFQEPWTETVTTWLLFAIGNIFVMLSLGQYNLLTLTYLVSIATANIILVAICLVRRKYSIMKSI